MLLGSVAAYTFYAFWHSETLSSSRLDRTPHKDFSHQTIIPKAQTFTQDTLQIRKTVTNSNVRKSEKGIPEEENSDEMLKPQSPQTIQEYTDSIYENLTPENYEETIEEGETAFEEIDIVVEEQDSKMGEEMESEEETQEVFVDEVQYDEPYIEDTSQEEEDLENEDISNL